MTTARPARSAKFKPSLTFPRHTAKNIAPPMESSGGNHLLTNTPRWAQAGDAPLIFSSNSMRIAANWLWSLGSTIRCFCLARRCLLTAHQSRLGIANNVKHGRTRCWDEGLLASSRRLRPMQHTMQKRRGRRPGRRAQCPPGSVPVLACTLAHFSS